jgi:hypothetical protein
MTNPIDPDHYKSGTGEMQCIDAIRASMAPDAFEGFLKGNCIKYLWRYIDKNGIEDLRKAEWYIRVLRIEHASRGST